VQRLESVACPDRPALQPIWATPRHGPVSRALASSPAESPRVGRARADSAAASGLVPAASVGGRSPRCRCLRTARPGCRSAFRGKFRKACRGLKGMATRSSTVCAMPPTTRSPDGNATAACYPLRRSGRPLSGCPYHHHHWRVITSRISAPTAGQAGLYPAGPGRISLTQESVARFRLVSHVG
jgi:hypothetical protein